MPKINLRGWLATWAQKRRRARRAAAAPAETVPAILLESDGHGHLTWTLNFDSDWPFSIYWSEDGLTWGHSIDGTDGGARAADASGMAGYFRICQSDWDGNDILPCSNVVYSDGL